MDTSGAERKLAAILCADVVGYSRLMGEDDEATLATLTTCRGIFSELVQKFRGRVVNAPGDSILAEFASVVDAVSGAVEIQKQLAEHNSGLPESRRMDFRIGVNLGDVLTKEGALYGDGVNVAARLEALAEPGGICISRPVHDQVESRLQYDYEYLGEQEVKNIARPVRAYRVGFGAASAPDGGGKAAPDKPASGGKSSTLPGTPAKPSVAVLAFENMSGDPEQEYFSDGISEDIITDLSRLSGLTVVGRNSSFAYKGRAVDLRQVGQELGVRYVMEGSVRKAGERVRITAQLIDTESGNHAWAGRFDRTLEDVFAIQDEITEEIVTALDVELLEGELQRVWRKALKSYEARAVYRQGNAFFAHPTREGIIEARQKFERVLELEPESPVGYQAIGWTHWYDVRFGWNKDPAHSLALAWDFVQEALGKDADYPAANILLAGVHLLKREFDQAIAAGERAESLAPNHGHVIAFLSNVLVFAGNPRDGVVKAQKAIRLNPTPPAWYLSSLAEGHYGCGQYEEAVAAGRQATSLSADDVEARVYKAAAHEALGQHEEAGNEAKELLRAEPGFSLAAFAKTQPYKDRALLDGLLELLRKAGLPD